MVTSLVVSLCGLATIYHLNKKATFLDKKLISQLIYFINLIKTGGSKEDFTNDTVVFNSLHAMYYFDEYCLLCKKGNREKEADNENDFFKETDFFSLLLSKIISQIKHNISLNNLTYVGYKNRFLRELEYNDNEILTFQFLRILFKKKGFNSTFKMKKIIHKLNNKTNSYFYFNLNYYLSSELKFENEFSQQFEAIQKYEESFEYLQKSIDLMCDLFVKISHKVKFNTNLYETAKQIQNYKNKSKNNINSIKNINKKGEINDNLNVVLPLIYRFTFNSYCNDSFMNTDFSEIEKKLNDYYDNDKHFIMKYDTKDDSLKITHISGSNLVNYNNKDFKYLFPPQIRKDSVKLFIKKLIKEDKFSLNFDMVIKTEENEDENDVYIRLINIKCKIISSLDYGELRLTGTYEVLNEDSILFEKEKSYEKGYQNSEDNYYLVLVSKAISEYLLLTPSLLNLLRKNNVKIYFSEIFEKNTKTEIYAEEFEITYLINYDKLKNLYFRKFSEFPSRESKNTIINIEKLASRNMTIPLKLKRKPIFSEDNQYANYSYQLIKTTKTFYCNNVININVDQDNSSLLEESSEIVELKPLTFKKNKNIKEKATIFEIVSVSTASCHYNNMDSYNGFSHSIKRTETDINSLSYFNEIYRKKISRIYKLILVISFLTISLSFTFLIICYNVKNKLSDIIELQNIMSSFQDNFYYSVLFSFLKYVICPSKISLNNSAANSMDYFIKIMSRYHNTTPQDFLSFIKEGAFVVTEMASDHSIQLKNKIYYLGFNDLSAYSDYYSISSENGLSKQRMEFFEFTNIILKNTRLISYNTDPVFMNIFRFHKTKETAEIDLTNLYDTNLNELQKATYENIINYSNGYKYIEVYEYYFYGVYITTLNDLDYFIYLFASLSVAIHVLVVLICFISISYFRKIIKNANLTILNLTRNRTKEIIDKFKTLKKILTDYSNPTNMFKKLLAIEKNRNRFLRSYQSNQSRKYTQEMLNMITPEDETKLEQDIEHNLLYFDEGRLTQPYIYLLIISFSFFIALLTPFFVVFVIKNKSISDLSKMYRTQTDLGHSLINDYIFTKVSMLSNQTDKELDYDIDGEEESHGFLFDSFIKIQDLMIEMSKFYSIDVTTGEVLPKIDCDFIYTNMNETIINHLIQNHPNLVNFPKAFCKELSFTDGAANLFLNIAEVINYSNKKNLDRLNFSNSYESVLEIYQSVEFFELSMYLVFVIRPIQTYIKESVILDNFNTSADSFFLVIILFFTFNILLEIAFFLLIHFKFNKKIIKAEETFSEFLQCIQ